MSQNRTPSLINGSAGKPVVATAGQERPCKGCGVAIIKGEKCFDIPNPRKAFSNSRRFCVACFKIVLSKTRVDIEKLEGL